MSFAVGAPDGLSGMGAARIGSHVTGRRHLHRHGKRVSHRTVGMAVERQPDMAARHFHAVRIVGEAGCPADDAVAAGVDRGEQRAAGVGPPVGLSEFTGAPLGEAADLPLGRPGPGQQPAADRGAYPGHRVDIEGAIETAAEAHDVRHVLGVAGAERFGVVAAPAVPDHGDLPAGPGALAQRIGDPAVVLLGASVVEPDPGEDRLVADAPEKSGEYGQRAVACEVTGKQQHGAAVSGGNAVAPQYRVGQQPPQFQGGAVLP